MLFALLDCVRGPLDAGEEGWEEVVIDDEDEVEEVKLPLITQPSNRGNADEKTHQHPSSSSYTSPLPIPPIPPLNQWCECM